MQMNLDIVIPMSCADLHINVQDASGDRILAGELLKKEPTQWSTWVGDEREYKAEDWRSQQDTQYKTEEDVHDYLGAARKGKRKFPNTPKLKRGVEAESCRVFGSLEGNKVQGDFHITARGHGYMEFGEHLDHSRKAFVLPLSSHKNTRLTQLSSGFNFSHHINELSFGPYFPLLQNPLDNTHSTTPSRFHKYQYYLSIVPTIYTDAPNSLALTAPLSSHSKTSPNSHAHQPDAQHAALVTNPTRSKHTIYTNQYAVTEQSHDVSENLVPGIFFKYDIEPILLTVAEEWGGLLGLIVRCVNVVAGVLVAGGWLFSMLDWAGEVVRKRRRGGGEGLLGREREKEKEEAGGYGTVPGNNAGLERSASYGVGGMVSNEKMGGYGGYDMQQQQGSYSPYGSPTATHRD